MSRNLTKLIGGSASTIIPYVMIWIFPGSSWFHHQLIPTDTRPYMDLLDARTDMALKQLANCYIVFGVLLFLVFRTVREALPHDPIAQERILANGFVALGLADVSHLFGALNSDAC